MSEAFGPNEVELTPAAQWVCPTCGDLNFESLIVAELTPENRAQMDEEGDWLMTPEQVQCRECHAEFKTVDYNQDPHDLQDLPE